MLAIPQVVRRHPIVITLSVVILLPVLVFTLWAGAALHFTYSKGNRAGYLQKISQRGWICKTWEGELLVSAVPGSAPEKFLFTTRSDSIAALLSKFNGQPVQLDYEQHTGVPSKCFGDSEYFVVGVHAVGPR